MKRCESSTTEEVNALSEEGATWSFVKTALRECMTDLIELHCIGLLRTFSSEEEAAIVVGNPCSGILLKEKYRLEILRKLGGSPKKGKSLDIGNEILTQLQSQPCLSFGGMKQKQRVQHLFQGIAIKNVSQKISSLINKEMSSSEIIESVEAIWDKVIGSREAGIPLSTMPLLLCFKLSEKPLHTLRRAIRLYICGGEGPDNMRSNGSNAWMSVYTYSSKVAIIRKKNDPINPNEKKSAPPSRSCQWHKLSYPGLKYRLGLKACEFTDNFIFTRTFEGGDGLQGQIFSSRSEFILWERTAELRNAFDYLIERNDRILSIDRKLRNNNELDQKSSFDLQSEFLKETNNIELGSNVDPLTSRGRRKLLHELLTGTAKEKEKNEVFNDIQYEVSSHFPESHLGLTPDDDNCSTDAERMICAIAIVCQKILLFRFRTIGMHEMKRVIKRPWLRHLSWECVLVNIIWDCIEHMEKCDYHLLAVCMLETILHGNEHLTIKTQDQEIKNDRDAYFSNYLKMLLSRRTRGKALERLIIDKKHLIRKEKESSQRKEREKLEHLVKNAIDLAGPTSSIPLSHTRKLAKQLKTPLSKMICDNIEINELGIRLRQECDGEKNEHSDWSPLIDISVANSIKRATGTKNRCAYIGSEEDSNGLCHRRSLNVEELAMESYASGTIPASDTQFIPLCTAIKGGWRGWHCEGLHVRYLFRILCFDPILRHAFDNEGLQRLEQQSVFLHRYQETPLDLHVANSTFTGERSFYSRRRKQIDSFFVKLSSMCPQRIADLVYESIMKRKDRLSSRGKLWTKDKLVCCDIQQIRTLSMLAAGFGGKLLSLMFRCLCYDHRHYRAGLPDLLLVRGICDAELVDLGEWIGEDFKKTSATSIIIDRDDEFLSNTSSYDKRLGKFEADDGFEESYVPEKLHLSTRGKGITIQCMFIEVKSANDSLDERQRDWLNIIDSAGNARVCKFISKKGKKR